jgi:hypothetical protein
MYALTLAAGGTIQFFRIILTNQLARPVTRLMDLTRKR